MNEPRSEAGAVRYYCTAGNGMEPFLTAEVKRKLAAEDVCQIPGKVLFSSSSRIDRVCELKAAERLFLLLKHDSPVRLPAHISPAKAAYVLQSILLGDRSQWTSAVLTWTRLQEELADRRTTSLGLMSKREGAGASEEQIGEEKRCNVGTGKSGGEPSEEESGRRGLRSGEEKEAQTLETKRKREVVQGGDELSRGAEAQVLEKKTKRENEEECPSDSRGSVCVHTTTGTEHNVESISQKTDHMAGDRTVEDVENVEHVRTSGGEENPLLQPSRIKPGSTTSVPVSFRISCKCTGSLSRYFSTQEVSRVIGVGLVKLLGWKTDLKNPQLEVNVNLSDDHCLLGIPLTRLPLANRSYIKTTGLRSTVAWAMASLAQIQPGSCVVDPMCGVGTILIEAAEEHKNACFLGVDIDDRQLQKANENVEFAEFGNRIHLLKASSMVLPLPSASVDVVVCDLPFGRKFGTKTNMASNLPVIVAEMERILCTGGTLVLLLSPQLSCLLKKLLAQKDTGPASNQETKPDTGIQDCPSPSGKQQTFQNHQGVESSPTLEKDTPTGLQLSPPPPLSSLRHQATVRVSLGAIDGLIHKYVKTNA